MCASPLNPDSSSDVIEVQASNTMISSEEPKKPLKLSDIIIEENPPEVQMRPQRKYVRRKSTASYRWSGTEMAQIDGPPSCPIEPTVSSDTQDQPRVLDTALIPDMAGLEDNFVDKIHKYGLTRADLSESKCRDSCLASLLDQMSRSGEDFKVWDKDDHTFLQWYINKQMDIQIGTGKSAEFLNLPDDHKDHIHKQFDKSNGRPNEYFLRAFSRIFNRDIIIVGSESIETIHGGIKNKPGKGQPLLFGLVKDSTSDAKVFYSLLPEDCQNRSKVVEHLSRLQTNN